MNEYDDEEEDKTNIYQNSDIGQSNPPIQEKTGLEGKMKRKYVRHPIMPVLSHNLALFVPFGSQFANNPDLNKPFQVPPPQPKQNSAQHRIQHRIQQPNKNIDKMKTIIQLCQKSILPTNLTIEHKLRPSLAQLACRVCKNLSVQVKLECSHQTCVFCLQSNIKNLFDKPTIETLKKCRCPTCLILCTAQDLEKVFSDSGPVQTFEGLNIKRKCTWCKRSLNACKDFYTELDCMHLCSSCYSFELLIGSKACMACEKSFDKKGVTMSRKGSCVNCGNFGYICKGFYRVLHMDHLLCFECLNNSVFIKQPSCLKCNQNLERSVCVNLIKLQMGAVCPNCFKRRKIDNIKFCPQCNLMRCVNCWTDPNCERCEKNFLGSLISR